MLILVFTSSVVGFALALFLSTLVYRSVSHTLFEQSVARILNQVERIVEIAEVAIVRVGNHVSPLMFLQIIGEQTHLLTRLLVGSLRRYGAIVLVIHHEQQVEVVEIRLSYLSCSAVEAVATACATLAHTTVGQLSCVPVADACRVDEELFVEICSVHLCFHHALGSRRAAYITETDEQ